MTQAERLEIFLRRIRGREREGAMAAWIVDSPWLPGFAGVPTLSFYFDPDAWMAAYERAQAELDGAALLPGGWIEFGMAAEPSGFGSPVGWNREGPPDLLPHPAGLAGLSRRDPPDPESDGLMPVVLSAYERLIPRMARAGFPPRIAAARGPLAVAGHLLGITEFLMATQVERADALALLDRTTALCIAWLRAQLERMPDPAGVLVLDDLVGMFGPDDAAELAAPFLRRVFEAFPSLVHLFHNDTPNADVFETLRGCGIDAFNFSHEIDALDARRRLGPDIVLIGNLPPRGSARSRRPGRVPRRRGAAAGAPPRCGADDPIGRRRRVARHAGRQSESGDGRGPLGRGPRLTGSKTAAAFGKVLA